MKVYKSISHLTENPPADSPSSLTIGNFDGCHRGHLHLIELARRYSSENGFESMALSFDPRPEEFFSRKPYKEHLFTKEQKLRAFAETELDSALIQEFNAEFSALSREDFFAGYLQGQLKVQSLTIGQDFHFGKNRSGDSNWLIEQCKNDSCLLQLCQALNYKDAPISSTRIRNALKKGRIEEANEMLGRPYLLEGRVTKGEQIGRKIGFPTINLCGIEQLSPAAGVYAGYLAFASDSPTGALPVLTTPQTMRPAAINCGFRPTFHQGSKQMTVEAHLLVGQHEHQNYDGQQVGIYFTHYIREERTFSSPTDLQQKITLDIDKIKSLLHF